MGGRGPLNEDTNRKRRIYSSFLVVCIECGHSHFHTFHSTRLTSSTYIILFVFCCGKCMHSHIFPERASTMMLDWTPSTTLCMYVCVFICEYYAEISHWWSIDQTALKSHLHWAFELWFIQTVKFSDCLPGWRMEYVLHKTKQNKIKIIIKKMPYTLRTGLGHQQFLFIIFDLTER